MINSAARRHGPADLLAASGQKSGPHALAGLLAIGGPIGLIAWLTLAQMANVNWMIHQVLQSFGN